MITHAGFCLFERIYKVVKLKPRTTIHTEKSQLIVLVGQQVGWDGVSGDLLGRANSIARLTESHIWHPPAGSVALWVQQRGNGLSFLSF